MTNLSPIQYSQSNKNLDNNQSNDNQQEQVKTYANVKYEDDKLQKGRTQGKDKLNYTYDDSPNLRQKQEQDKYLSYTQRKSGQVDMDRLTDLMNERKKIEQHWEEQKKELNKIAKEQSEQTKISPKSYDIFTRRHEKFREVFDILYSQQRKQDGQEDEEQEQQQ
ncbi:MAG: hypothetical protein EZS28_047197, partial [Streblomastix strix]